MKTPRTVALSLKAETIRAELAAATVVILVDDGTGAAALGFAARHGTDSVRELLEAAAETARLRPDKPPAQA